MRMVFLSFLNLNDRVPIFNSILPLQDLTDSAYRWRKEQRREWLLYLTTWTIAFFFVHVLSSSPSFIVSSSPSLKSHNSGHSYRRSTFCLLPVFFSNPLQEWEEVLLCKLKASFWDQWQRRNLFLNSIEFRLGDIFRHSSPCRVEKSTIPPSSDSRLPATVNKYRPIGYDHHLQRNRHQSTN